MNEWTRRVGIGTLALALGCSLLGCNPSQPQDATLGIVRGTVVYKGKPLPRGFLHFYSGTNRVGIGVIMPDGSGAFEASVPAGPLQVLVSRDLRPDRGDKPAEIGRGEPPGLSRSGLDAKQAKLLDEVQKKYGSLKTAKPLTFDVAPGEQTWNINLD
jgi:hypothetical protein